MKFDANFATKLKVIQNPFSMNQLEQLKQRPKTVIDDYKKFKSESQIQTKNSVSGFYYLIEDSQPTKNTDGLWTTKRTITKKK